ncbi:16S rRNA (cytosine(1402)-N(4))-methyltransferase RsmH [Scatolibacter rhodanostii]|uniref:16S rRNA (cytosine(1402)-N(4))-methyltransferase RsmH n=1 Tax=Scatolibacter rhodanostii TaxID=2014781 RepID=UPI000C069294|nr:16S rRNA (cytosine(1402)-N(4))-methyltransferase RsmH [Scatolibacter rhodanostii]
MEFHHKPVLFEETIKSLNIQPSGIYIDGTMGGAGHSEAIVSQLTTGTLLSIDQDPDALAVGRERLKSYSASQIAEGNFSNMKEIAAIHGIYAVDGVLLDIGVSSYQLDAPERGFSFHHDAPLDMRMNKQGTSAADLVNTLEHKELAEILFRYGEEKNANRIVAGIIKARQAKPIETTLELAEIIKESVPAKVRRESHPARKTFQALRIAVNGELDVLQEGLEAAFDLLKPQGRLAVITFHSLEDRIVKKQMNAWCEGCICPKDFPVCVCGRTPKGKLLFKKGLSPTVEELELNPRARSARLRVIEKI